MKLMRVGEPGNERPALLDAWGAMRDLSAHVQDIAGETLSSTGLARLREVPLDALPGVDSGTRIGPPVAGVGKFICVGLNFSDHAAESGMADPEGPAVFMKTTTPNFPPTHPASRSHRSTNNPPWAELRGTDCQPAASVRRAHG